MKSGQRRSRFETPFGDDRQHPTRHATELAHEGDRIDPEGGLTGVYHQVVGVFAQVPLLAARWASCFR